MIPYMPALKILVWFMRLASMYYYYNVRRYVVEDVQDRYNMINSKNKSENSPFHYSTIPVVQSNVYTLT